MLTVSGMLGQVSCALATSMLYRGLHKSIFHTNVSVTAYLNTRYSGLSIKLLISFIFSRVRRSNTLMLKTARSDLVRGPSTVMKQLPVTRMLTTFCREPASQ